MVLFIPNSMVTAGNILKLACLGDSITYGYGLINRDNCYPSILERSLPSGWEVRNYGVNGACAQPGKDDSYDKTGMIDRILEWNPDIVLFMLGSNDSKTEIWVDSTAYIDACRSLIEQIRTRDQIIVLMTPPPAGLNFFGIRNEIITDQIYPALKSFAETNHFPLLDFTDQMKNRPYLYIDNVHPNKYGYTVISDMIRNFLENHISDR